METGKEWDPEFFFTGEGVYISIHFNLLQCDFIEFNTETVLIVLFDYFVTKEPEILLLCWSSWISQALYQNIAEAADSKCKQYIEQFHSYLQDHSSRTAV